MSTSSDPRPDPGPATRPDPPPDTGAPVAHRTVPVGAIVLVIAGAILSLGALGPLIAGGALAWAYGTQRDAGGFFTTSTERFETTSYAITSNEIDLGERPTANQALIDRPGLTTVRLRAERTAGGPVFIGIASRDDVDRYLNGVGRAQIDTVRFAPFSVDYRYQDGGPPPAPPRERAIWVASAEGLGAQTLDWQPRSGQWAVVVMNANGAAGVSVNASAGAEAGWVLPLSIGLLSGGALGILVGAILLVTGVVALARGTEIDLTGRATEAQPIRLEGTLDQPISRWLWLFKWLLLVPHYIVLAVLWMAFSVVTFIAFFAILFTGRYPRRLFEFNVGVLRWTWRVNYYGYSALGTDRYPPFSLGTDPDYPATFDVAYPEKLSRGLVLIKWWLLAIPQYLILGFLGGGLFVGAFGYRGAASIPFGGMIGLLVLFAALGLLFTGAYPRDIHTFVVGLNRWVYRVITYVALLRDEYPPFRLDQGEREPAPPAPAGPATAAPAASEAGEVTASEAQQPV
jgi:hypothetical protein